MCPIVKIDHHLPFYVTIATIPAPQGTVLTVTQTCSRLSPQAFNVHAHSRPDETEKKALNRMQDTKGPLCFVMYWVKLWAVVSVHSETTQHPNKS